MKTLSYSNKLHPTTEFLSNYLINPQNLIKNSELVPINYKLHKINYDDLSILKKAITKKDNPFNILILDECEIDSKLAVSISQIISHKNSNIFLLSMMNSKINQFNEARIFEPLKNPNNNVKEVLIKKDEFDIWDIENILRIKKHNDSINFINDGALKVSSNAYKKYLNDSAGLDIIDKSSFDKKIEEFVKTVKNAKPNQNITNIQISTISSPKPKINER